MDIKGNDIQIGTKPILSILTIHRVTNDIALTVLNPTC